MRIQPEVQIGLRYEFVVLDKTEMDIGVARFQHDEHGNKGEKGREKIRDIGIPGLRRIFPD